MPDALAGVLASRKAFVTTVAIAGVLILVGFKVVPWNDSTISLIRDLTLGWLGAQALEDSVHRYSQGKVAVANAQAQGPGPAPTTQTTVNVTPSSAPPAV